MSEIVNHLRRARSSSRVRRTLLVTAAVTACFTWAMMVVGFSFAMVERGVEHWWMMLVFGLTVLVVALAAGYGITVFWRVSHPRGAAEPPADATFGYDAPAEPRPAPATAIASMPVEPLSRRELEVLEQLAAGRSNREIADALYVAPGTVKAHLNHIFRKLEATSRLQAVTRAREAGLLDGRGEK